GLTMPDLEQLTGSTREELVSVLWFLCEKNLAGNGELADFSITADGFDIVESKAEERWEFRALATLSYYGLPASDQPHTHDAKAFLHVKEAYGSDTHGEHSERFRLRGREFFDGIKGEQLRRLAVLCLLHRQATSEMPGLPISDLEQLTGCTREELGSALWYL